MKTSTIKHGDPSWHVIDAADQSLGRMAATIARVLRGKHKATFSPHQLCGDHVVVVNVGKLKFSERQLLQKEYYRHSGYIGHLKTIPLKRMIENKPEQIVELAVKGMLPKTKLRAEQLKRLHIFVDAEHTHEAQKPSPLAIS